MTRKPDELWAGYIARRLNEAGIETEDAFNRDESEGPYHCNVLKDRLEISILGELPETAPSSIKLSDLETTLAQHVSADAITQYVTVNDPNNSFYHFTFSRYEVTIEIDPSGDDPDAKDPWNSELVERHFSKYEVGTTYIAAEVLDDIIAYAKDYVAKSSD